MKGLFKNKPFLILIIAVVLLCILAFVSAGDRSVSWLESAVGTVTQPIQSFSTDASNAIIGFFQRLFKTTDADKENEQLKVKLAQLELVETENERLEQENERLKELLNYTDITSNYEYVTATVIGKSQGIWFDVFTINVGRNHGVDIDMPVVNSSGLVGRVSDVGATWCKVTTIIDSISNVSVMVERTRDNGMMRGILATSDDDLMELYYLPTGSDLVPGDIIVTNGMGGVYPRGLVVGTVTEVTRKTDESTSSSGADTNAMVQPSVDFAHLEEVMVVIDMSKQG